MFPVDLLVAAETEHRRKMREDEMQMSEVHSTLITIFMLPCPEPQK